jgi:hypothetical protein
LISSPVHIPNLLLLAGTGTKSGKTTIACRIIDQFPNLDITSIKITPHFHKTTPGLLPVVKNKGYSIFKETDSGTSKDTSRMLHSGAHTVYLVQVWDDELPKVFNEIMKEIPQNTPVICESPALRNYIEPGVFIIMTAETINKPMNVSHLQALPHLMFKLEDLESIESIPIGFEDGKWFYEV